MSAENAEPSRPVRISWAEWRWILLGSAVVLLLTGIPYLLAWRVAVREGLTFSGFLIGVEDGNSYLAKMAQGARGHWLFHLAYTSEPHDGALLFSFYLLLGRLTAALPGSAADLPLRMIWAFHLARLACSAVLLLVVYRFVAEFIERPAMRFLTWVLIAIGGGLGWLLLAVGQDNWLGGLPLDIILPEGFTFLTMLTLPHVALGRALLLAGMLVWLRHGRRSVRGALAAGFLWLLMGLVVPFYPLVAGTVVGATLCVWWLVRQQFPRREFLLACLAGVLVAPGVLYTAWVFTTNPVMQGWSAQNLVLSPSPLHYLAAYGVPGLLAIGGVVWVWRTRPDLRFWLPVAWLLVVPILLYVPFSLQRRLVESYQAPLTVLAVLGIEKFFWPWLQERMEKPAWLFGVWLSLMVPTALVLVVGSSATALAGHAPIYHSPAKVAAAAWLAEQGGEDALVVADYSTGNFIPGWTPVRVYLGHGSETIDYACKAAEVQRFFAAATQDAWRAEFLQENDVDFVLAGPDEEALSDADRPVPAFLRPVFRQDDWVLYEVNLTDG